MNATSAPFQRNFDADQRPSGYMDNHSVSDWCVVPGFRETMGLEKKASEGEIGRASRNAISTPMHAISTPIHAVLTLMHAILTRIHADLTLIHAILTRIHADLTLIHAIVTLIGRASLCMVCRAWFRLVTTSVTSWYGPPSSFWMNKLPR